MNLKVREKSNLNVNDVIEISLMIDTLIPNEDLETKTVLNEDDYEHDYDIVFIKNEKCIASSSFRLDAGCYPDYGDDIESCAKEEMELTFPEVTDYEIFDVDNSGSEIKTARIRVNAIKEN